jgi:UV DNA damage endonuclease
MIANRKLWLRFLIARGGNKMRIRLGYVANALRLENATPSGTVTYQKISKLPDRDAQISLLTRVAQKNLANTLRILRANFFDQIQVYRFSSKLIPLCTHPEFLDWDYARDLEAELQTIGTFVKENRMRVSLHPDHFTLLNSPKPEVLTASLRDLDYHVTLLEVMGLDATTKLVIHIGGKYQDRGQALSRFKSNFYALPERIRKRLILENDDRCFSAVEVLRLAEELALPMVLDLHHHQLLNHGESLASILPAVWATWTDELPPKVHLSSPRDQKNPRYHADFVAVDALTRFLQIARELQRNLDVMLEAKQKDLALLKLAGELRDRGFSLSSVGELVL